MSRSYIVAASLVGLLAAATVVAGEWFDIGGGTPVTIYANGEIASREVYSPFPFGLYPLGSLVFEDFKSVPCDALDMANDLCGETQFIRGFECNFSGASCGCSGALVVPTAMRFAYDPLLVQSTGIPEESLKLFFRDEEITSWTLMPGALVDTENNLIVATWSRSVLGKRQFAFLTNDITPVALSSWGRIKTFYRR